MKRLIGRGLVAVCSGGLVLTYGGLAIVFATLRRMVPTRHRWRPRTSPNGAFAPTVCLFIPARNEAPSIRDRLENIFDTEYPSERLTVVVASDGSTDDTVELARSFSPDKQGHQFIVLDEPSIGRAAIQNLIAATFKAEILISTDAETRFFPNTIGDLVAPFEDDEVGFVGGTVTYEFEDGNHLGEAYSWYRRMEQELRDAETDLGVLVKVDGPCVAYRREIWQPIHDYEDVDQVVMLLANKHGKRGVQSRTARCLDRANESAEQELRQRRRMTRKALLTIFGRLRWRDLANSPGFVATLLLHKVLRFFSPFMIAGLVLGVALGPHRRNAVKVTLISAPILGVRGVRSRAGAFGLAQLSFAAGVFDWLRGDKSGSYQRTANFKSQAIN